MIRVGDVLLYKNRGFVAAGIRFFTRSKYNHVSMVIKKYSDHTYKVVESRAITGIKYATIHKDEIYEAVRHKYFPDVTDSQLEIISDMYKGKKYDFMGVCYRMLLLLTFRIRKRNKWHKENRYYCSELVADIYSNLGLYFQDDMPVSNITPENIGSSKYTYAVDI